MGLRDGIFDAGHSTGDVDPRESERIQDWDFRSDPLDAGTSLRQGRTEVDTAILLRDRDALSWVKEIESGFNSRRIVKPSLAEI